MENTKDSSRSPEQIQDPELHKQLAAERRRRLEQPILNDDGSRDYIGREGDIPFDPEMEKHF